MTKEFNPSSFESHWIEYWKKNKTYKTPEITESDSKAYILDMYPYPSGSGLHVGHPRGYLGTDVIARFERMNGKSVLHPMGFDSFGLPAENYAIKTGVHPEESTNKSITYFKNQIANLGFSFDWDREISSHDPETMKWTQKLFLKLYEKGLAYQAEAAVNWCPKDQTVLANEQVEPDGTCERCGSKVIQKNLKQWFFKITDYADRLIEDLDKIDWPESTKQGQINWIGRSEGAEIRFKVGSVGAEIDAFDTILFATGNESKLERIKMVLKEAGIEKTVVSPKDLGIESIDISENGTLTENALEKALAYAKETDIPVIAMDTGLFMDDTDIDPVKVKRNALIAAGKTEEELSQEEIAQLMVSFYSNLAKEHGGSVDAYFSDAVAIVYPNGQSKVMLADREVVIMQDQNGETDNFFPLNSLYKIADTNTYYNNATKEQILEWLCPLNKVLQVLLNEYQLRVFSTAHDTIYGATFMVAAPEHELIDVFESDIENFSDVESYIEASKGKTELERQQQKDKTGIKLEGIEVINPVNGKSIPIFVADYVLGGYGTGAIMAVPAHDERDFEFAKSKGLEVIEVVETDGKFISYTGEIKKNPSNFKMINSDTFSGEKVSEAREKIMQHLENLGVADRKIQYRLRDWLVSRQRFWGNPIPIVYDPEGNPHPVKEEHLPITLPKDVDFNPDGVSPMESSASFVALAEKLYGKGWRFEVDTLDTFVDSSWYFFRFTDPNNSEEFASAEQIKKWMPVDLYVGGAEHTVLHLMYARFITKVLFDEGIIDFDEPFQKLRHQGMILAEDSRKMSKRWGNTLDPNEEIEKFGADTLRVYEMFMGPFDSTMPWDTKAEVGVNRFLKKFWGLSENYVDDSKLDSELLTTQKRIIAKAINKVEEDIPQMQFNTAIAKMMETLNELSNHEKIAKSVFEQFLKILAPFAPFLTEQLWNELGNDTSIHLELWPEYSKDLLVEDQIEIAVQVNGKVRGTIQISPDEEEAKAIELAMEVENVASYIENEPKKVIYVKGRILNIIV